MEFSGLYIIDRLIFRLFDFLRHWYRDAVLYLVHSAIEMFENADRSLALRITFTHFFEPLYGDYSVIGRVLGVVLRAGRLLVGCVAYTILSLIWTLIILAWMAIPALIVAFIFYSIYAQS